MFPINWDKQRILEEIAYAYMNKVVDNNIPIFHNGTTTNGIKLLFVIRKGIIETVHPVKK